MKLNSFFSEIIISTILIAIAFGFLTPTSLAMPMNATVTLLVVLIGVFLLFSSVVWLEKGGDERENLHRLQAGRFSFLIGSSTLVLGIVVQTMRHNIDPWLVFALVAMILSKIASRLISRYTH